MTRPTLPVVGRIQQCAYKGAFAIFGLIVEECLDVLWSRRQTGDGEAYAPYPHPIIGRLSRSQFLSFQLPEHKAIDRIRRPGRVLYLGRLNLPGCLPDPGQAVAELFEVELLACAGGDCHEPTEEDEKRAIHQYLNLKSPT